MSTAKQNLGIVSTYTVASGQSATKGYLAILSGADNEVDDATSPCDLGIGVFLATAVAGARVEVAHTGVIPVKVGTGGATRGKKGMWSSGDNGFADAPAHDADGNTNDAIYGVFLQSGSAGDMVGMLFTPSNRGSV
jgi:hypothetical protein